MKVKMLTGTTWGGKFRRVGDELDVPVNVGIRWVNHKIAEEIEAKGQSGENQNNPLTSNNQNGSPAPPKEPTLSELKEKAKQLGIEGYKKMDKDQLIAAISEIEKANTEVATAAEKEAEELAALKLQADELGIEGFDQMTKGELIEAIKATDKADGDGAEK